MIEPQRGTTQPIDTEASPTEFAQRCYEVRWRWLKGELPFKEALAMLNGYKQEAITAGNLSYQAMAEYQLGYFYHYRGSAESSIDHYKRARAIYERLGNREYTTRVILNLGEEYRFRGDFDEALELYRVAYLSAEEINDLSLQTFATLNSGWAWLELEEWDHARRVLEKAEALVSQLGDYWQRGVILCELYCAAAIAHLRLGNTDSAWGYGLKALEVMRYDEQPRVRGYANRLIGELISESESAPEACLSQTPDEYFQKAMTAFREILAEAEIARTVFTHARSLAVRGERIAAVRKFQQAMLIFNRLGMIHDAARAAQAQLELI